ncbi:hypothetical protein [Deinococcus peraridilitoris]|uniref:Uncharacterized protein n=1 Tax=Deinococcus peraridilitoris (strain DSM 19664 / LMG 22246 / CIP 109416 / KR-200) TaxID=937777 RepID=L0A576_DEIPD|nr:hypothetical protein [Deinococcus peraridilitoris]AFZ69021.1 hypothetical protein Deipe_3592 [Deinococcus peraridilitoris DSM 19664]
MTRDKPVTEDLRSRPDHADLAGHPRNVAFVMLGQRFHLGEAYGFGRKGERGRIHLVRLSDGLALCRARFSADLLFQLSPTGSLTCASCLRAAARRVHQKFQPRPASGAAPTRTRSRRKSWQR